MVRVIYVPEGLVDVGACLVGKDKEPIVVLDERLKKHKELCGAVLKHEMGHIKYGRNPLKHFWHDITDAVPIWFTEEWLNYKAETNKLDEYIVMGLVYHTLHLILTPIYLGVELGVLICKPISNRVK